MNPIRLDNQTASTKAAATAQQPNAEVATMATKARGVAAPTSGSATTSTSTAEQQAKTSTTKTDDVDPNHAVLAIDADESSRASATLSALLQRAGVAQVAQNNGAPSAKATQSTSTSSLTSTTGASAATLVRSEPLNKVAAKNQIETNLGPVTAPRVELNTATSKAAQTFAQNVDKALGNHLQQTAAQLARAGVTQVTVNPNGAAATLAASNSPISALASKIISSATMRAATTTTAVNPGLIAQENSAGVLDATGLPPNIWDVSSMSSDQLLAEFLKLNIDDPNENVQTYDDLYTAASNMRKLALEIAEKMIENAEELMKEAEAYADQVQKYANMAGILGIFMGLLGPLGAILSAVMQIMVAVAQYEAQMMIEAAKEMKNNAERFVLMSDMHEDQIKDVTDVINTVMQNKNDMVDHVMQMMTTSFASQQQLLSATMAR